MLFERPKENFGGDPPLSWETSGGGEIPLFLWTKEGRTRRFEYEYYNRAERICVFLGSFLWQA